MLDPVGPYSDFPIFAVPQFRAQKSGVLEIQVSRNGSIYLTAGRVDAISSLSDDLRGLRLVAAGVLSEEQLRSACWKHRTPITRNRWVAPLHCGDGPSAQVT